jgi:eukaryotic-like serine/threonine-protein kinase
MSEGQATAQKSGAPDPLIGRVIADRFKIVSLIARGGMGKVYRAEQAPLGRLCAVKVLNPNYNGDADPEFHQRFFREASITSQISHPNSVTIFDYGKTDDEIYYMAMEYLEGQTLHHALREGGVMSEERVGRIAAQICRALREAHSLDVIHRDLKPANIFLTRHGDDEDFVKVLDFGLVKHLSERPEEQLTQTGLFMGSPKYMAPEQIQGGHVDARTDIYSLGIIMYEMLAGKVPFDRPTSVNILMAHVGEPPPPMREVNPNLVCSPVFEELVMRCIAKDPAERYRTMEEVLVSIKRAHGVSMTGQLAAVNIGNMPHMAVSGQYTPVGGSQRPPPTSTEARSVGPGSNTPMGLPRSQPPPSLTPSGVHQTPLGVHGVEGFDLGSGALEPPPRRSKAWIFFGVVLAAVVGGALGMAAFHYTSPAQGQQPTAAASSTPPTKSAEPSPPLASAAPAVDARVATVKVTTEPAGASVKEDAIDLCPSTPCDVKWKGDDADPAKLHKLTIAKPGFRPELRPTKASEGTVHVKLSFAQPVHVNPGPTRHVPPSPPPTKPDNPATTPSGFKDLPY